MNELIAFLYSKQHGVPYKCTNESQQRICLSCWKVSVENFHVLLCIEICFFGKFAIHYDKFLTFFMGFYGVPHHNIT